jgi:ACS family D-galactonate transporter-like MFS transporter
MPPPSTGRTRVRWWMVFMAFLATTVNYVDRANLGVAAPFIQQELGLSNTQMGWILGAFFWTYAAFQLPSGWLVDRLGARLVYAGAVVWWSFFTMATAVGRGFAALLGFRLLLGAGEAPAYPSNAKVVAEWFPRQERAFATSIFDSGARVGTALSLPIVTTFVAAFGWRTAFVVTGLLGFVWTAVWLRSYRPPRQHAWASPQEIAYIEAGQAPAPPADQARVSWRGLFGYRAVWGMMLGFFCLNFVVYFFVTWFPTYLVRARGFTLLKLGFYGMIPALAAVLGGYLGGLVSDRLTRGGMSLTWARKLPIVGGMLLSSCVGLAVIVPSAPAALALFALSYSGLTFAAASVWALPADMAPSRQQVGSLSGIQNFASNVAGIAITYYVGRVVDRTGSFVAALAVAGGFSLLGAFAYLVIVPEIAPLRPRAAAPAPTR